MSQSSPPGPEKPSTGNGAPHRSAEADRRTRVRDFLSQASALPLSERGSFLARACEGDESLRAEIDKLLAAADSTGTITIGIFPPLGPGHTLVPGQVIGRFIIEAFLGAGGMGQVYAARDGDLERTVAIKLLLHTLGDHDRIRRFIREARASSALNHPNIVTIHEHGQCDYGRFIVMELVQGRSLQQCIQESLAVTQTIDAAAQMAKAVASAHAAGIVHRDLKPANVMLRGDGLVKVLDFGLARLMASEAIEDRTGDGVVLGTVRYMSPEQGQGLAVGSSSDIFSLGLVFYELATGRHPFAAPTAFATFQALATQAATPPSLLNPEVPPLFDDLILRMLEKSPEQRPDAQTVANALEDLRLGLRSAGWKPAAVAPPPARLVVGRDRERAELLTMIQKHQGASLVCVAGEPGLGKTTLVEDVLEQWARDREPHLIGRGRCSEHARGEAYLPLLAALGSLITGDRTGWVAFTMKTLAPSWFGEISASGLSESNSSAQIAPGSLERMTRELTSFLQTLSRERDLVLFLDDVHWADDSTIDFIAYLLGHDNLKLLLIVAYRESDLLLARHPFLKLKLDLQARRRCREVQLGNLDGPAIERFLAIEFPGHRFPPALQARILARTEGHPLFSVDLVRYLRDRGAIVQDHGTWILGAPLEETEKELPESVRSMIQRKMEQITEEDQRLLAVASVQGQDFDSAVITKVMGLDALDVEDRLEKLERLHRFVRMGEERDMPDGTLSCRYRFVHALYQDSFFATLRPARRTALSAATAHALRDFHTGKLTDIAGELARLSAAARENGVAADYYLMAAGNAAALYAHKEAVTMARRGLECLALTPAGPERVSRELPLQVALGQSMALTVGYTDTGTANAFNRAIELGHDVEDQEKFFPAIFGLWMVTMFAVDLSKANELAGQLLRIAEHGSDPVLLAVGNFAVSMALQLSGQVQGALDYSERVLAQKAASGSALVSRFVLDPFREARCNRFRGLWLTGFPDQAWRAAEEELASLGRGRIDPRSVCSTLIQTADLYRFYGKIDEVRTLMKRAQEMARQNDMQELQWILLEDGWALAHGESIDAGIAQIQSALDACRSAGVLMFIGTLGPTIFAERLIAAKRLDEAMSVLEQAVEFMDRTGHYHLGSEVYRLQAEVLALRGDAATESAFRKAVESAQRSGALSLELRAAVGLARWLAAHGRGSDGHALLETVYGKFTEGFGTTDLQEAAQLLRER